LAGRTLRCRFFGELQSTPLFGNPACDCRQTLTGKSIARCGLGFLPIWQHRQNRGVGAETERANFRRHHIFPRACLRAIRAFFLKVIEFLAERIQYLWMEIGDIPLLESSDVTLRNVPTDYFSQIFGECGLGQACSASGVRNPLAKLPKQGRFHFAGDGTRTLYASPCTRPRGPPLVSACDPGGAAASIPSQRIGDGADAREDGIRYRKHNCESDRERDERAEYKRENSRFVDAAGMAEIPEPIHMPDEVGDEEGGRQRDDPAEQHDERFGGIGARRARAAALRFRLVGHPALRHRLPPHAATFFLTAEASHALAT